MNAKKVLALQPEIEKMSATEILAWAVSTFGNKVALASSLGLEDQVLTDMLLKIDSSACIFTLDTGRLFQETYNLIDATRMKYNVNIEILFPEREAVQNMVTSYGPNLFYDSVEKRKLCCKVRKVDSLKRKLATLDAWITGLRREQSVTRTKIAKIEWDETYRIVKLNPLSDWSEEQVWKYIKENKVPYNKLHDQGYPSIGCAPCTRAIKPGEDIRAGRWWWEKAGDRECGLHIKEQGEINA